MVECVSPVLTTQGEPVLAEVLNSLPLFGSFFKFMSSDMAHENVLFLKEVQLFQHMRRPVKELHKEACRLFFTFVCEGAVCAVNLGSETQKTIKDALWSSEKEITSHLFDDACLEITNLIMPKFREWLALKEWSQFQFQRLPPPTFNQVIRIPELTTSFCDFIKKQNSDSLIFEQFKTTDGIAEEHPPAETVDELDISLRSCDETCSMILFCAAAAKLIDSAEKKSALDDEAARHLWNQYRKKVPIKHTKSIRYGVFVGQWLQWLISEFNDSTAFGDWIDQRSWVSEAAYECVPVQTLDENGYQVFPTLACLLSNKYMISAMQSLFGDCEITKSIRFLCEVYKFVEKYSKALVSDKSSTPADSVLKQMTFDGKELYTAFIGSEGQSEASIVLTNSETGESNETLVSDISPMKITRRHSIAGMKSSLPLDKKLKSELKTNLFSRFKGRVTYDVFTRSAAYVYRRCENTWFRDIQHSYIWACMNYDNNNIIARAMEALFDPSIVRDVQDSFPPLMDDILQNDELRMNYLRFTFKSESELATVLAFLDESKTAVETCPPEKIVSEAKRLLDLIALLKLEDFAVKPMCFVCNNLAGCKTLNPLVLNYVRSIVFESTLSISYVKWAKSGIHHQLEYTTSSDQARTETSFITALLESFLGSSERASKCVSKYNRVLIPGQQILFQKSKSQFRLVDSSSSHSNRSSITSSPTSTAVAEPGFGHADFSSANSSSSGSVNTTIASDVAPLVGPPLSSDGQDIPPLNIPMARRVRNPLAANQEVITTPHPRVSDIVSYLPRVPTFDETMDSSMLRKMFEDYYLFPRLVDETEQQLWKRLRDYAASFARLSDEDVTTQQPELRAKAMSILDDFPSYLRKQPFLKSRITNNCFVTIRFFREEEKFLYGLAHQSYESLLERSGWLRI